MLRFIKYIGQGALVQTSVWLIVVSLEFFGFLPLERKIMDVLLFLYSPASEFYSHVTPTKWQFMGNVPYGLSTICFGVAAYSAVYAIIRMFVGTNAHKRSGVRS